MMLADERRYTAEEATETADRAVLESILEEGCSRADAIRAKIAGAFAPAPEAKQPETCTCGKWQRTVSHLWDLVGESRAYCPHEDMLAGHSYRVCTCGFNLTDPSVLLEVARRVQDLPRRYTEEDMNAERVRVQEETEAEVLARDGVYTQEEQDAAVAVARVEAEARAKRQQAPAAPEAVVAVVEAAILFRPQIQWSMPDTPSRAMVDSIDALLAAYPDGTWRQALGAKPEPVEAEALVSGEVEPEPVEVWVEQGLLSKWAVHVRAGQYGWKIPIARKWPEHTAKLVVSMLQHLGVPATLREEGE